MSTRIISTQQPGVALDEIVATLDPDKVFLITDSNTHRFCLPQILAESAVARHAVSLTLPAGDDNKTLESAGYIWKNLSENGATRRSLVVNLGGGMVSDLGGFAAAAFKRGIPFINIPTTLLGAVDAAVGGKTGINFLGFKNEIGFFRFPVAVIIATSFLATVSRRQRIAGFAEMIKMAYLFDSSLVEGMLECDPADIPASRLLPMMSFCVGKKNEITLADLDERGSRKLLNFGHTAGHAFESLALERNISLSHGEAVAHGILYALILSRIAADMPADVIYPYHHFLNLHYRRLPFGCNDTDRLISLMGHDKKNQRAGRPAFILIRKPGDPVMDCILSDAQIRSGFEIFNELSPMN